MLESYVRVAAQRGAERCAASVPREMAATGATGASAGACVKESSWGLDRTTNEPWNNV
jgi:hypothetical protein